MGRYELPGYLQFQAEEQALVLTHGPAAGHAMLPPAFPGDISNSQTGSLSVALLGAPGAGHLTGFATTTSSNSSSSSLWAAASIDGFEGPGIGSLDDSSRRHHSSSKMDALYKLGSSHQHPVTTNSRLGNLQYSSNGHSGMPMLQHSCFNGGKLHAGHHHHNAVGFAAVSDGSTAAAGAGAAEHVSIAQQWDERTNSPYKSSGCAAAGLIGTYRGPQDQQQQQQRDSSTSPFGSYSSSPRGMDFRSKRHSSSSSANGMGSPRTPTHGPGGHRIGIDPRLVVGSPLEIAWEVLQSNPRMATLLNLQPATAKLRNLPVQEDDEDGGDAEDQQQQQAEATAVGIGSSDAEGANSNSGTAGAGCREPDVPLSAEQLTHEQGLVRSCRGLPARVRDDLIKAARLAVTRRDSSGRELPGTGLVPFFWRVQANLKWLLQQPATLKGQLLPGQIDFITEEQRGLSFQKTVQQRMRLGELAVMLFQMLQVQEEEVEPRLGEAGACAAGSLA